MGFPRIISKTNKIYTKLGEFCLSADGNNFWIVCHTCQEELQTQDIFWKHIQDEHNFMLGLVKEQKPQSYTDGSGENPPPLVSVPIYRKTIDDDQQQRMCVEHDDASGATVQHDEKPTKEYAEMRAATTGGGLVGMDIKLEPHSMVPGGVPPTATLNTTLGALGSGGGHVEVTGAPPLYQMPQVPPVSAAYAALVQQHVTHVAPSSLAPALSMAAAAVAVGGGGGVSVVPLPQELPKDSNSTNASAGSAAVSSDDGERWYICDYETCGLKFKYQSRLELHRSVHSKERRFACELCGASFKQSCNLSTHRKKKHFLKGLKGAATNTQQLVHQRF